MANLSIITIRFGLTLCILGILYAFLPFADFVQTTFLKISFMGTPYRWQSKMLILSTNVDKKR